MPQLSLIFFPSSKTGNIPMKLFTCLIEINIAQLCLFPCSCLNVWKYTDCCGMEQVVFTFFIHIYSSFSSTKTQVTLFFLSSHSNSPAGFAKIKFFRPFFVVPLRQKHATVNAATWFLFIYLLFFWSGCTLGTERVIVLGTGGKKKKKTLNVPLVFEKWCGRA